MSSPIAIPNASSSNGNERRGSSFKSFVPRTRHNVNTPTPSTSRASSPTESTSSSTLYDNDDSEWISVSPKKRKGSRPLSFSSGSKPSTSPCKSMIALFPKSEVEKHTNGAKFFPFEATLPFTYSIRDLLHLSQSPLNRLSAPQLDSVRCIMEDLDYKWLDPKMKRRMERRKLQREEANKSANSPSHFAASESTNDSAGEAQADVEADVVDDVLRPEVQVQTTQVAKAKPNTTVPVSKKDSTTRRRRIGRRSVRAACLANGRSFRGQWNWPQSPVTVEGVPDRFVEVGS